MINAFQTIDVFEKVERRKKDAEEDKKEGFCNLETKKSNKSPLIERENDILLDRDITLLWLTQSLSNDRSVFFCDVH